MIPRRFLLVAAQAAASVLLISCGSKPAAEQVVVAESDTQSTDGVAFVSGFHKEEHAGDEVRLRWTRQEATLRLEAPTAGTYRIIFKPITVFSPNPVRIDVKVNGAPAGSITAAGFDLKNPTAASVDAPLQVGVNEVTLSAKSPDVPLGATDPRKAAIGLVLPVRFEPLP